jgi:hypothetical protein
MVADDVEAALGAGDGDIQQVGGLPREPAGAGPVRVAELPRTAAISARVPSPVTARAVAVK